MVLFLFLFNGFASAQQPGWQKSSVLFHGPRSEKKLALTFDACPSSTRGGFDELIVHTLIDSGVPATFFFSGRWLEKHRMQAKKLASISFFEFGNHSFMHRHMTTMTDSGLRSDLRRAESLLKRVTGGSARLFRPPYAELDTRLVNAASDLGLTTVMYDLASGDPDSTISPHRLARYVTATARNGSIIVMHVNGRGWHTAEVLPEIIQALRRKGYSFVKVSELLEAEKKSSHPERQKEK